MTKSAMITVCGRPNVGKSTLTNALVGEKVAIVSSKPQTTRNRITAIVERGETQFVLMDTKLVEFVTYGKFKHLAIPVSHKESECIAAFNWLAGEMERRLKVFAKAGCCRSFT